MFKIGQSAIHGRGILASRALKRDTLIETAHLLACDCGESPSLLSTRLGAYAFYIEECAHHAGQERIGIALSTLSFLNHSPDPNLAFEVDVSALTVAFTTVRRVNAGEELTIDYGEIARGFQS